MDLQVLIPIVVFFVVLFIIKAIMSSAKGALRSYDELRKCIGDLIEFGLDDGLLIITVNNTKKFIQFLKYVHKGGIEGIELSFPETDWSKLYFQRLKEICDKENIKYKIVEGDTGIKFLDIDCKTNIDFAHRLIGIIINDVLSLHPKKKFRVMSKNLDMDKIREHTNEQLEGLKRKNS